MYMHMPTGGGPSIDLPRGRVVDFGDLIYEERWLVKGRRFTFTPHWGAEQDTRPEDRVPGGGPSAPTPQRRVELVMDLHADKKRTRTAVAGDEFGNPTTYNGAIAYTVENPPEHPDLVSLTDNGDGSCVVAATGGLGNLGVAMLTFTATPEVGDPDVRVEAINVIPGGAEAFLFEDGPEEETTPDA